MPLRQRFTTGTNASSQFWLALERLRIRFSSPNDWKCCDFLFSYSTAYRTKRKPNSSRKPGHLGAITIATNMAGRGTDISLSAGVKERGGLHVIGFEFHDSKRTDDQLAGRSGRQGDPGSCQFFCAADDALLAQESIDISADVPIDGSTASSKRLLAQVRKAQKRSERRQFESRSELYLRQHWLEKVMNVVNDPTLTEKSLRTA